MKKVAQLGVVLILIAGAGCQEGQTDKSNQPEASGDNAVTPCPAVLGNGPGFAKGYAVASRAN